MQKIYLVRHGKTEWNIKGLMQGSVNIPLIEEGIEQAKELSKSINIEKIDVCLCSPLKRAKQTAEILCNNKLKIIFDERLKERSFGDFEGKEVDFDLIAKQWDYKLNDKDGKIESIQDCLKRAKLLLDDIKIKYPNKTILIVSHGSFMKALHFNLIGYNEDTDFLSFNPKNTTLYEYDF